MHNSGSASCTTTAKVLSVTPQRRLAAAQGNVNAQSGLGVMYGNGKGVTRDYVRAHMWFDLGAASGSTDSANNRDLIAKRMTPKQIAEAQKMAVECKNKGFKGCD